MTKKDFVQMLNHTIGRMKEVTIIANGCVVVNNADALWRRKFYLRDGEYLFDKYRKKWGGCKAVAKALQISF